MREESDPTKMELSISVRQVEKIWVYLTEDRPFVPPRQDSDDKVVEDAINQFNKEDEKCG